MQRFRHIGGLLAAVALLPAAAQVHGQYAPYAPQQYQQQQSPPQYQGSSAYKNQPGPNYGQPAQAYNQPAQGYNQPTPGYNQPAQGYNRPTQAFNQPAQGYGYNPQIAYGQQPAQPRYAMAMQNGEPSLNAPAESVAPGIPQPAASQPADSQSYSPAPSPMVTENYGGYNPGATTGPGCNCQTPGAAPAQSSMAYESYPTDGCAAGGCNDGGYAGYGCATGGCGGYSTYGCGLNQCDGGRLGGMLRPRGCNYWFGGVYGLLMERDHGDKVPLTMAVDGGMPPGSYSPSNSTVLTSRNVDTGFQPGVEFRLGRTFGGYGDGCGCCTRPCWGLEGVYWTLFDETASASYAQTGTVRLYSMLDPRGLEYNPGSGYRPLRDYMDYAPPAEDHTTGGDIWVRNVRVRSSFEVQNVELNLLRLPLYGGGVATCGAAAAGCGGCDSMCSTCDPCAGAACGGGCGGCGCGSRFSCVTLCGFRYLQLDESFMYGVDYDNVDAAYPAPIDGFMNYNAQVTNDLYGFQLGCNGMYRIGCKWGVHLSSNFGLYGNDIDVHQYFQFPSTGMLRYIQSGQSFDARASKTDVAMIGELRLGASYQYSCHCRLYGGWRVLGISGVALATDQVPGAFIDAPQMNSYVNSNGSLILHGMQAGVEWNY
ncbi:MAG: hypothetical protein KDA44_16155 [Planctomycetales bacterium]|nr:hypothetical protein [Planctomycetales bacterium]